MMYSFDVTRVPVSRAESNETLVLKLTYHDALAMIETLARQIKSNPISGISIILEVQQSGIDIADPLNIYAFLESILNTVGTMDARQRDEVERRVLAILTQIKK